MTADHFAHLDQFGADLWKLADQLRANSGLASNEYFMPILGLLFLRHATNRYYAARKAIAADQAAGRMPKRSLRDADFTQRRAMNLPEAARYDVILEQPKDGSLGHALVAAIVADYNNDKNRGSRSHLPARLAAGAARRCRASRLMSRVRLRSARTESMAWIRRES